MTDKSTNQQLEEAIKLAEAAAIRVEELKKATREEDLKTVKTLIERHTFTQTDLKSVLKSSTGKRAYTKKSTK
jgi:chromosome segregation and condensation protein ScpB